MTFSPKNKNPKGGEAIYYPSWGYERTVAGEYACVNNESSTFDTNVFQRLQLIHHKRRMKPEIRKHIFELRERGVTVKKIATKTGFSESAIRRLCSGKTYKTKAGETE